MAGTRGDDREGTRVGRYILGCTLGEGTFGKVKAARRADTGAGGYAVKIIERCRVSDRRSHDQIKREIHSMKLLRHPNVVRLYEVLASKTKIYIVLEHLTGGDLFDKIEQEQKLSENEARRLFQQLIDAVSYCHDKGVYHRDLKPENVLINDKGNIKVLDFGVSAFPQQIGSDGLLHTTCGSPNYCAPEVLANKGYDGAKADIWSCGVILYMMLVGAFPFEDPNIALLYKKILKGALYFPWWLSASSRHLIKKMLNPNPQTRITMDEIKEDIWFKKGYSPIVPEEQEFSGSDDEASAIKEIGESEDDEQDCHHLNAFGLIGMSSSLDLSSLFEEEDVSGRTIRFISSFAPKDLFEKIDKAVTEHGYEAHKAHGKLKILKHAHGCASPLTISSLVQVFKLSPSLYVVEMRKTCGYSSSYRKLCELLLDELGLSTELDYGSDGSLMHESSNVDAKFCVSVS